MSITTDAPAPAWDGRSDGPGDEHARWHSVIEAGGTAPDGVTVLGFASDEGVRRNYGRPGAAEGPAALRGALGSLAAPRRADGTPLALADAGDVVVDDGDLEGGQERLGSAVAAAIDAGTLPVVLGGGHAVAYGTYLGVASSRAGAGRHGVFNVDAHFDLRSAPRPTSGTPFLQMFEDQQRRGRSRDDFRYSVAGISRANNTEVLFATAREHGVAVLEDDACDEAACGSFVEEFLAGVDAVHLTIDLDAMPAAVAPGVSAPAGFGVEVARVRQMCRAVAASGRLAVLEVAELNPRFDVDGRTARLAARLIDEIVRTALR